MTTDDLAVPIERLPDIFPDAADAYISVPIAISLRLLARTYAEEGESRETLKEFRARCRSERWVERRAIYQQQRSEARRDALVGIEAQFYATLALDFHTNLIRSALTRYQDLDDYVTEQIRRCADDEITFTPSLALACKELKSLEEQLGGLLPTLQISEEANRLVSSRKDNRKQLVHEISTKFKSLMTGHRARESFDLILKAVDG